MVNVIPKPIILNNVAAVIGADNYEAGINRIVITPTVPQAKWKGMTPGSVVNLVGDPEWAVEIQFAQDHETAAALSLYLFNNVGKEVTITFKPVKPATGTSPTYTMKVVILPGLIGGDLDASNAAVASVTLPVNGAVTRSVVA